MSDEDRPTPVNGALVWAAVIAGVAAFVFLAIAFPIVVPA
jgi:hypothetical protein